MLRHIPLSSLYLGLEDLFGKRRQSLVSFANGAANEKLLVAQRDRIKALPPELLGRPLVDELSNTDARHDGVGAAIWFTVEAYERHPDTTPDLLAAGRKIRAAFITGLDELKATYEVEAEAAKRRRTSLVDLKAELTMFPVAGGLTVLEWATQFVDAGEQLSTLLSKRADAKARKLAGEIRARTVGLLNRVRAALLDEMSNDPALPATLEQDVFGYLDDMEEKAAEAYAEEKKAAPAKAAAKAARAVERTEKAVTEAQGKADKAKAKAAAPAKPAKKKAPTTP
jgi:hypothetical protein